MLRPARPYELGWLAAALVRASVAANRALGLPLRQATALSLQQNRRSRAVPEGDGAVSDTEGDSSADAAPGAPLPLRQRIVLSAHNALAARGVRVNLRPLADTRTLAWVAAAAIIARLAAVSAEAAVLVALLLALGLAVVAAVSA